MQRTLIALLFILVSIVFANPVNAHDLVDTNGRPVTTHQHVWRPKSYGQDYRQGHSVNNSVGSITIWSPNEYQGYKAGSAVRFARPTMRVGKPKANSNIPQFKSSTRATTRRGNK